ncbi:ISAs1 family transposase [Corynebacterium variabile]|uniref:ISAs1 family transposase n=1 Tax=Corynebacterium variabile TaxID=1727 RepID=UPI001144879B|nr:ISAs1 family transposase [Corynebacterium variabile]
MTAVHTSHTRNTHPPLDLLADVTDHRDPRGTRHPLVALLAACLTAALAGNTSYTAIAEWIGDEDNTTVADLGIDPDRRPSEAAVRRVLSQLDADLFDRVLGAWMFTRTGSVDGRSLIAVDGKTIRGARDHGHPDSRAPHEVAAFDTGSGTIVGQVEVDAKTNEIPAACDLLNLFDLHNMVVSLDALHTQDKTAKFIVNAGGDYVMTIKKNRRALYDRAAALPWDSNRTHTEQSSGHGRRETRSAQVFVVGAEFGFPHAAQVVRVTRHRTDYSRARVKGRNKRGKKTRETVYVVCSLGHVDAPVATLAGWVRAHWGIENRLHWVRDVVFGEDACLIRAGAGPRVMATLRSTAISVLRLAGWCKIESGTRYYRAVFSRPSALVTTIHHRL